MGETVISWLIDHSFAVHGYLLITDAFMTWVVVKGILWETKGPRSVHDVAHHLVVWGVAAETVIILALFAFDERISSDLQNSNNFLIAQGQETEAFASRARRDAAKANERAAQLEKEAADATAKAAEAELELAKIKLPRTLSTEQQAELSRVARQFPNTSFIVTIFNDPETIALMNQIEDSLIAGGWVEKEWKNGATIEFTRTGKPPLNLNSMVGVFVQADVSKSTDFKLPAVFIANALKADGIAALSQVGPMPSEMDKTAIFIQIGKKPL